MRRQQQLVVGLALVAAISGVAAFPLLNQTKRAKAQAEPETAADEPGEKAEVKAASAPAKKAAQPQRRRVTRWSGGGDVVVGGSSGSSSSPSSSRTAPRAPGRGGSHVASSSAGRGGSRVASSSSGRSGRGNPNEKVRVHWTETEYRRGSDGSMSVNSENKSKVMTRAEADKFIADMKGRNETEMRRPR